MPLCPTIRSPSSLPPLLFAVSVQAKCCSNIYTVGSLQTWVQCRQIKMTLNFFLCLAHLNTPMLDKFCILYNYFLRLHICEHVYVKIIATPTLIIYLIFLCSHTVFLFFSSGAGPVECSRKRNSSSMGCWYSGACCQYKRNCKY